MSGEKKLSTFKEILQDFQKTLDQYSIDNGLWCVNHNPEAEEILSFTREHYKALSAEECYENAAILARYSMYLQKEFNRHYSINEWAERNLKIVISEHWDEFATDGYNHYDIISNLVIKKIGPATTLHKIIEKASSRISELRNITHKVDMFSDILKKMGDSKRWKK